MKTIKIELYGPRVRDGFVLSIRAQHSDVHIGSIIKYPNGEELVVAGVGIGLRSERINNDVFDIFVNGKPRKEYDTLIIE